MFWTLKYPQYLSLFTFWRMLKELHSKLWRENYTSRGAHNAAMTAGYIHVDLCFYYLLGKFDFTETYEFGQRRNQVM